MFFWQKSDKFLVTIDVGKKDRMELATVFSTGCASRREQGKEGAMGCYGSEGWRLLVCPYPLSAGTGGFAIGKRGCMVPDPIRL